MSKQLRVTRQLTDIELDVLNTYCSEGNYSSKRTATLLDRDYREIYTIIKREPVQEELKKRQEKLQKKFNLSEIDILNKLWDEANNYEKGANHNARITALVWIGKHLGMWQEKKEKEETQITYNIINYSSSEPERLPNDEKVIEHQSVLQEEESFDNSNIQITNYV